MQHISTSRRRWFLPCRKDTGEILGVHIFGLHAADLIHEASNAVATGQTVTDIKFNVHAHPTLSEVRCAIVLMII